MGSSLPKHTPEAAAIQPVKGRRREQELKAHNTMQLYAVFGLRLVPLCLKKHILQPSHLWIYRISSSLTWCPKQSQWKSGTRNANTSSRHSKPSKKCGHMGSQIKPTEPEIGVCHPWRNMRITTWYCLTTRDIYTSPRWQGLCHGPAIVGVARSNLHGASCLWEQHLGHDKKISCFLSPYQGGCSALSIKQPNILEWWWHNTSSGSQKLNPTFHENMCLTCSSMTSSIYQSTTSWREEGPRLPLYFQIVLW